VPKPTVSLLLLASLVGPFTLRAQSLLERPPNVSGDWTGSPGTLYFHFLHRFAAGDAPERKVSNVPTFLVAAGLPRRLLVGASYSTNSTLAPRFPNEWELLARWQLLSQDLGRPLDLGAQLAYNNAAQGIDAELSAARRVGIARVLAAGRALSDPVESGDMRFAAAGGVAVRLGTYVALAGDAATLLDRDAGEKVAWSAGLHLAIPLTPHTLSLQATNTLVTTLQGASRGTDDVRYGFEFTVPLSLGRYFGRRADTVAAAAPVPADTARTVRTTIRNTSYLQTRIEIAVGSTIEWTNADAMPHSVTAVDRRFDSGLIGAGGTWRHTFTQPGTYEFYCMPHPFMKGTVVVSAR
jgi:plastocyanin